MTRRVARRLDPADSSALDVERYVVAAGAGGGPLVSHPRNSPHRRVASTAFRFGIHLIHVVSNLVGDDVVGRSIRSAMLKLGGAELASESTVHGGTYISKPANLRLGFHTLINRNCYLDLQAPVVLGDYSGVGHGTTFITTIHDVVPAMNLGHGLSAKPITVGDRAWIGANVTVLPGVNIGHDAIVAVGTLVVRDVPPNSLVAGVPGRMVRKNVRHWLDDFAENGASKDHDTAAENGSAAVDT